MLTNPADRMCHRRRQLPVRLDLGAVVVHRPGKMHRMCAPCPEVHLHVPQSFVLLVGTEPVEDMNLGQVRIRQRLRLPRMGLTVRGGGAGSL